MDTLTIILISAAVAAFAWTFTRLATGAANAPKRKLQERLASTSRLQSTSGSQQAQVRLLDDGSELGSLAKLPSAQILRHRLAQAFPNLSIKTFLALTAILSVAAGFVGWTVTGASAPAACAAFLGAYAPFFVVQRKRASWNKKVTEQIPEALDFLSRVLRAGQSLATGLQMMSEELPQPLGSEFRRAHDQHGLGQPIEDCLRDMAVRLESPDFSFFVTAVVIQRSSGGDLAEVLKNISTMVRQRLRLSQSVRAKTAEGRLTGSIMVAFPVVMFALSYALNPERGRLMLNTSQGKILIGIAVALVILGLFLIKRITTVRV